MRDDLFSMMHFQDENQENLRAMEVTNESMLEVQTQMAQQIMQLQDQLCHAQARPPRRGTAQGRMAA